MIKEIGYNSKYLHTDIVRQCFQDNTYNFVDKQHTGNGFTTGFLKLTPTHEYKSNIIIVPNRKVVESKKLSYDATKNKDVT